MWVITLLISVFVQLPTLLYVFVYLHGDVTTDKLLTDDMIWNCWFPTLSEGVV